ncbi:MAG: oligoendopeptidase F [Firmicutes bacterium]|nr:oligoendopeptidase F [Bacillota bacterium]
MGKSQKLRSEIDEKYKWDLSPIYKCDEDWYKDLKIVSKEVEKVSNYKGKIVSSANGLLEYLEFSIEIERKLYKLYYYAHLNFDADTTNDTYQQMHGKIQNLLARYDELDSFSNPEMMKVNYDTIKQFYNDEPKLKEYEFMLEQIYRYKEHILDEKSEAILSAFSKVNSSPEEIYEALTDSDIKFGMIVDENGEEVELTESNYSLFLESENREVRKNAFNQLLGTYSKYKNTIANTFSGNVEVLTTLSKLKKFSSSLEASLFGDNVDRKVYDNLIDTVSNNLDTLYKYFDLKKEVLGVSEFHLYDQYNSLVPECNKKYTFEEARTLVVNALSVLGDDYVEILNKAFDERWIDVYNNKGKRTGAYSSGFYDTNPYILLNYEGKFEDVSTLAHELGHSMHTYYSCKNNPYQYSHYRIFVAEVASTVNELLLKFYQLNNTNDINEKKYIINVLMNSFKSTIYRQVMFAEYERDMHALKEKGEILTSETLSNYYYELNKKYFGPNVVVDDVIRYEWERIPHFYYNFYVYKYAIGLSCACYIVNNILSGQDGALENYKKFLKSGGSDYPVNELKLSGIDITKSEVIVSAIKMFDSLIEQFKKIN